MAGTRYVRYIAFAFICLVVIFFISSSSAPTIDPKSVKDKYDSFKGQWKPKNPTPKDEKPTLSRPEVTQEDFEKAAMPQAAADKTTDKATDQSKGESKTNDMSESAEKSMNKPSSSRLDTSPNRQGTLGSAKAPGARMNATFVTLARNSDLYEIVKSIRQVEDRFNHRYGYDWVFLNDKPFDEEFKKVTTNLISGKTRYGLIPEEHWSFPEWIDQDKAAEVRKDMAERKIIYGDSVSYRHMCRYESGFFFRHEIMKEYEWYWRVEPSIELYCDIEYDTFEFMAKNEKMYSFVISLYEYMETIPTIWDSVKTFIKQHPEHVSKDNSMDFLSDDNGKTYNKCHFWSNFEIGNLNFFRSQAYIDFFNQLDKDGGFFYERWGDAPVHSIAAGLLLKKEQIHFFNDIAYYHVPFTHCPTEESVRQAKKCHCNPKSNFDWNGYSCTSRFYDVNKMKKPDGYDKQTEQGG